MKRRSAGFTLIELMVVIGIILLLVSIVVFGLRHIQANAAKKETLAEMNICQGMISEYAMVNGMLYITVPPPPPDPNLPPPPIPKITVPNGPTYQVPIYIDSATPVLVPPASLLVGGDLTSTPSGDMGDRGPIESRYKASAVQRTQAVMFIILKDQKNRANLSSVPSKRVLEGPPDPATNAATVLPPDYSVILDGWANPIIFVPRGGMVVWMNPSGTGRYYLVRSSGTYECDATGSGPNVPPVSTNDRPFFASAGQDGIFSDPSAKADYGIDNIYSFQR